MQKATNQQITEAYSRLHNIWKVADELGMCGQSVHERLVRIGIKRENPRWTQDENFFLKEHYSNYLLDGKLQKLADEMGRTKQFICRKAKSLGLTDISRPHSLIATYKPHVPDWNTKPHPRGMKGKKHTPETKFLLSNISTERNKIINAEPGRRESISKKQVMTKMERGNLINPRQKQTWKAGWREIGGKRKYFRSRWEANYARYLEFLKVQKQIKDWEHESKVFWFEGIKRGCVSFLPDFEITELNNTLSYHEVKGWMDDRSKTKLRRMKIYYPDVILKVIDAQWFKRNSRNLTSIIYGWET